MWFDMVCTLQASKQIIDEVGWRWRGGKVWRQLDGGVLCGAAGKVECCECQAKGRFLVCAAELDVKLDVRLDDVWIYDGSGPIPQDMERPGSLGVFDVRMGATNTGAECLLGRGCLGATMHGGPHQKVLR